MDYEPTFHSQYTGENLVVQKMFESGLVKRRIDLCHRDNFEI
jgi:hypothetical protein